MTLVVFDVDGTLVDSQHHIVEAQGRAFAVVGLAAPTRHESLSVVGLSLHEAFLMLVGRDGPVAELVVAYKQAWTAMRAEAGFDEVLYPCAAETIARFSAHPDVTLGIATGKSRFGVDRLIRLYGWEGLFATIQTADDHPSKPHPAMLHTAMAETGRNAEDCVMIGDTSFDMSMAQQAGVRAIGVSWGYHDTAALTASGAACIVESFEALHEAVGLSFQGLNHER